MKASDLFVKALENEGVEYIFGIPGEENLDLLESLRSSSKININSSRHEQGAAFMAATYGRLTAKLVFAWRLWVLALQILQRRRPTVFWRLSTRDDNGAKADKKIKTGSIPDCRRCPII